MASLGDVRDSDGDGSNQSLSKSFYNRTSFMALPKSKYSGEGSEAAKCTKFLTALSASLKAGDRRVYACWEGKSFLLTTEDFTSYAYKEAAGALLTKQAAEGYPLGLFLQHIELELSKIRVEIGRAHV